MHTIRPWTRSRLARGLELSICDTEHLRVPIANEREEGVRVESSQTWREFFAAPYPVTTTVVP